VDEDADMESGAEDLVSAIDKQWLRWKRPLILTVCFVVLLGLYVFVFPLCFWLVVSLGLPDWIYDGVEKTAYPLIWMDENFRPYTLYIEWLGNTLDV